MTARAWLPVIHPFCPGVIIKSPMLCLIPIFKIFIPEYEQTHLILISRALNALFLSQK